MGVKDRYRTLKMALQFLSDYRGPALFFIPLFATYCRYKMTRILGIFHTRYDPPSDHPPCKIFKLQKGCRARFQLLIY